MPNLPEFYSQRELIMQAVQTRLEEMSTENGYAFKFGVVQREEFDASIKGKEFAVAIFDPDATRNPKMDPVMYSTINVVLECMVLMRAGEEPSTKLSMVLSELERRIMEDMTFGGLVINCTFIKDQKTIDFRFEKYIECALWVDLLYRYSNRDPRVRV